MMTIQAMDFSTQIRPVGHQRAVQWNHCKGIDSRSRLHLPSLLSFPIPETPLDIALKITAVRAAWTDGNSMGASFESSSTPLEVVAQRRGEKMQPTAAAFGEILEEQKMEIAGIAVSKEDWEIACAAALAVVLGIANKVLNKLALVPLKNYPFFLAQFSTFGYVVVYFAVLFMRHQAGVVTDEMLTQPKFNFAVIGILEALGIATGMAATAVLPGTALPILSQTFLVWQLLFSTTFLRKRYSPSQILGCVMVIAGVVIALISGGGTSEQSLLKSGYFWPVLMILSFAFQAGATIVKEFVFEDAKYRMKGGSMDLFVVNSYGSAFQALFIIIMLPVLSTLRGIPFSQLPSYFQAGTACLFNVGSLTTECQGAPFLPLLFVAVNMGFNISLLRLLKMSSAVISSLCTTISVPLSIYIFTLPLPYIGEAAVLSSGFFLGVLVVMAGLACYNLLGSSKKHKRTRHHRL